MSYTSNIPSVIKRMQQIPIDLKAEVTGLVTKIIYALDIGVHEKTPVWSGLAIRNMIWSVGTPNETEYPEIKSGDVTNEGRRSANEAAARNTRESVLAAVHQNPFGQFWLSNAAHHIYELEMGQLPSPQRSRVPPGGMFGLTYAQVKAGNI